MRRQYRATLLLALVALIACSGFALAQYGLNPVNPFAPPQARVSSGEAIADRIAIDVVAALAGFIIGAFFSPLLRPVRRWAFFALLVAGLAYAWFGKAPIADWLAYALAVFCFFIALGYGLRLGWRAAVTRREEAERPTSFGSAKWATEAYLRERGMFDGRGFLLGDFPSNGRRNALHYSGARHLLTVAPTRSGKGVAAIVPNLLTYEGSTFIIDPKGENALITALRRGQGYERRNIPGLGQSVHLLDPWDIVASDLGMRPARFNPLDWIKPGDADAAENAFLLAEALVPGGSEGEGRFWDDEAKALLTGIILFVATSMKEAANRHLGRVRDILLLDEDGFKAVLSTMYNEPLPVVASTAARTASKEAKLRSNVLATVQAHTHFLDSPRIRESLSSSDFSFEDLKTKPMTVYLILPADRLKTFDRWLRLLIQQAITVNARNITIKPERPVLFLLDEMASLGRLSMVEQAYGLMAGFGMQLWGIVQDLSQLERIYGDGWQTFISNSGVIQYFGSRDKITAEYFSTLCGVTTIRIFSLSQAIGRAFGSSSSTSHGGGSSSTNESTSHTHTTSSNESQRQLAYPDELMVLRDDSQIIFIENLDPISATKVRWYQDENLRTLGINLHPQLEQQAAPAAQVQQPRAAPAFAPSKPAAGATPRRASDRGRVTSQARPSPAPLPAPEAAAPTVVKQHVQGDIVYTMYSDDSILMETPTESRKFASMDDLRAYITAEQPPAGSRK